MKYVYIVAFAFLFLTHTAHAQVQINYAILDINQVKLVVSSSGALAYNPAFPKGNWMPATDTAGTIFFATPVIGGISESNDTLVTYLQEYDSDYNWYPGPLNENGTLDSTYNATFNHVWKISMDEINTHVAYFQSLANNTTATLFPNGYTIPSDFLTWPAHGDVSLGYNLYLAPFHDYNSDGIYNPNDGDYPTICGDQCLLTVTNDIGNSAVPKMGNQLLTWIYAFNTPENPGVNQTFFVKYKFTNKSSHTYSHTYISTIADLDIGYSSNDFAASNVAYGAVYGYNGTATDNQGNAAGGNAGYGTNPPAQSIMLLAGPALDADGIDNPAYSNTLAQELQSYGDQGFGFGDGIADNERSGLHSGTVFFNSNNPTVGVPNTAKQYYAMLQGKRRNGNSIVNNLTGNSTLYWAPGNSDVSHELVPAAENFTNEQVFSNPTDIRVLANSAEFTYEAGSHDMVDFAYVFARADLNSNVGLDSLNIQYMNATRHYFNDHLLNCQDVGTPLGIENLTLASPISIFPNPADNALHLVISEALLGQTYRLYNNVGQLVLTDTLRATQTEVGVSDLAAGTYVMVIGMERKLVVIE